MVKRTIGGAINNIVADTNGSYVKVRYRNVDFNKEKTLSSLYLELDCQNNHSTISHEMLTADIAAGDMNKSDSGLA